MDNALEDLKTIVRREVEDYAAYGIRMTDYPISDDTRQTYAVIGIPDYPREFAPHIAVMARIVDDYVVIEADITDRPLANELMRVGIPRERIILAYAGETLPQQTP